MRINLLIFLYATVIGCTPPKHDSYPKTMSAEVVNPLKESRKDVLVHVSLGDTANVGSIMVRSNEVELPAQLKDNNVWIYLDSMKGNEKRKVTIYFSSNPPARETYTRKRTQAYENGLESEKVAYLIEDSTINFVGKTTSDLILMGVSHDKSPVILKGGVAIGFAEKVNSIRDGSLRSSIGISSLFSINAGSRLVSHYVSPPEESFHISILKNPSARIFKSEGTKDSYGYLATYGRQSTKNDNLGLVVLFSSGYLHSFREDEFKHVIEFKPDLAQSYYFAAAWEQEPNGIKSETDFIKWVEKSARELANPVIVNVK